MSIAWPREVDDVLGTHRARTEDPMSAGLGPPTNCRSAISGNWRPPVYPLTREVGNPDR